MSYGACDDAKSQYAARISYLIGADGKIEKVWGQVDAKSHPNTVLEELGGPKAAR
jgi:peroxiredoxin